jgi:hypothetical protein
LRLLTGGRPGVLHGNRTYLLQDEDGQILEGHSISAGLDYPGHRAGAFVAARYRPGEYVSITDTEALAAFQLCCETEGIIPALEPSHALAHVAKIAPDLPSDHLIVMNMCGRGDKDIFTVTSNDRSSRRRFLISASAAVLAASPAMAQDDAATRSTIRQLESGRASRSSRSAGRCWAASASCRDGATCSGRSCSTPATV